MISFESFTITGDTPIYQQIVLFVKRGIVSGAIEDGEELPSRRTLSTWLTVNPNTAQKAYRQLEEEGLIESHSGAKSLVSCKGERLRQLREELLQSDLKSLIRAMRETGFGKEEALQLMDTLWEDR